MRKTFGILFGFFCLAILDSIFAFAFPIDFTYTKMSAAWHFYLTGILVFVRDKPWFNRMLIGAFAGIVRDLFFTGTFPFCFLLYPVLALAAGIYQNKACSVESACVIYISILLMVDFLPYIWQRMMGITNVSFFSWFYHVELLTILTSSLVVIATIYVDLVMDRFYLFQSRIIKKSQSRRRLIDRRQVPNTNHPRTTHSNS
ncbi:hypothetical protein IM774_01780 [Erysipelotrichaceae bacterium RD49]|nr:hypothetical protein [Erysipelotrichaceae bacterium RD49]